MMCLPLFFFCSLTVCPESAWHIQNEVAWMGEGKLLVVCACVTYHNPFLLRPKKPSSSPDCQAQKQPATLQHC